MELLFENRYMMSKKRLMEWAKHPIKKNMMINIWIGIMVCTFFMFIFSLVVNAKLFSAFFLLLSAFSGYRAFFRYKILLTKQFSVIAITQGKEEWERVIQFTNCIIVNDGNTKTEYQWSQIMGLIDDSDYLILLFQRGIGIRLDKKGFTKGSTDSFLEFVKKEYRSIPLTRK